MMQSNISMAHLPALVIALFLTLPAHAQGEIDALAMSLEQLADVRILSMPKFAENAAAIPSAVSILKRDDIRQFGWRTLGDALRTLQGINVTSDHSYDFAGVRGVSPPGDFRPRMQILIDGIAINENIYAGAPVDSSFPLDIGLIERIEVVRGPSASVYGGDAMFGVINIVTRSGHSLNGTELAAGWGTGLQKRLRASWGGRINDTDVLVSATDYASRGHSLGLNDTNAGGQPERARGIRGEQGEQLFLRARGSDWRATVIHGQRERKVPTSAYGTILNDDAHLERDRYDLIDLAKDWTINSQTGFHQRLYFGQYEFDGRYPYDYSGTNPDDRRVINRDIASGRWWVIEQRLSSKAWRHQHWTLGLEYRADFRQKQINDDLGFGCYGSGNTPCLEDRRQRRQATLYLQDEINIGSQTLLTLGMRYDYLSHDGGFWSPRLGLVHNAGESGIFKLLYGTAFRTPTVYERYYSPTNFPYGNPNLRPEKLESLEVTWEKRFLNTSRLTLTAFAFEIDRLGSVDNAGMAINGSTVQGRGLEAEVERWWRNGVRLRGGFSAQRASDHNGLMDNSPTYMVKFNAAIPTGLPGLSAGLENQWVDARRTYGGQARVAAYNLANLNFMFAPTGQAWDLSFGIYNLFDHRYRDPVATDSALPITRSSIPQLGRSLLLQGSLRF